MDWTNWHKLLPLKIETDDNWEKYFNAFYKDSILENPEELVKTRGQIFLSYTRVDSLKRNYERIVNIIESNINSPDFDSILNISHSLKKDAKIAFYKKKLKYKDNLLTLLPINPYAFNIPSETFKWIPLIDSYNIQSSIDLTWDRKIFSDFQIKLSPDCNFNIETTPKLKFRLLRCKEHKIYLFEKNENENESNDSDVNLKLIPYEMNDKIRGTIDIAFGQAKYKYEKSNTEEYIKKIKNLIKELEKLCETIVLDKNQNNTNIENYKKKYYQTLSSL